VLIVNADDWGYDAATTDAIAAAHRAGAIDSATAMVHMRDSERAARLAGELGLPVGLHLNLMEPYSAPADEEGRQRQAAVVDRYRSSLASHWLQGPRLFGLVAGCVEDQLNAFGRLYSTQPTHVDGHQHGHLSTAALVTLRRRRVPAIRRSFTFRPSDKPLPRRVLRRALNGCISSTFRSTAGFHSIRTLHPRLGGHGLEDVLASARARDVEIMVHPGFPDECEILLSAAWSRLLDGLPRGSYRDLGRGT
jgi:chitin disaccharide deacetylase